MQRKKLKYIIYTPDYNENSGGILVLHYLCHLLNESGCEAYLFRLKPPFYRRNKLIIIPYLKYCLKRILKRPLLINNNFNTPEFIGHLSGNEIVVYPDMIPDNPLNAPHVVRWIMHKPGYITGFYNYEDKDLLFYFHNAFNTLGLGEERSLKLTYILDDIYYKWNHEERDGTCYIMRKGKGRKVVHDVECSLLVDGLSHRKTAEIFNQVKYCISYDPYTMYNRYAAICGCIVIYIPENGVSKEEWMPNESDRYGIAYGFDDIEHAIRTASLVKKILDEYKSIMRRQLYNFIEITQSQFVK